MNPNNNIARYDTTVDGTAQYKEVWYFSIQHDQHTYGIAWALANDGHGNYDWGVLLAFKDNILLNRYDDDNDVLAAVHAAVEFRIVQLRKDYPLTYSSTDGHLSRAEQIKNAIESLAQRSFAQEYVGQKSSLGLYVQDVAKILHLELDTAWDAVESLVAEKRVGLNDFILIPFERYALRQKQLAEQTGHSKFESYDTEWHCNFCGAHGDFQDDPQPQDIECIEGKYV